MVLRMIETRQDQIEFGARRFQNGQFSKPTFLAVAFYRSTLSSMFGKPGAVSVHKSAHKLAR